jgi:hypothetical protein
MAKNNRSQNPVYVAYYDSDPEDVRVDRAFDNDSPWPRRLLRISTMKSHPWRSGNIYDGAREPPYFAITYTWGRWQLAPDSHPSLKPLDFGTPWPIPRVEPDRFTPENFVSFIKSLSARPPSSSRRTRTAVEVDFLWLDVACIDQRDRSHEKELEIDRQAAIFSGAHQVFAWLHQFENSELQETYQNFRDAYEILLQCFAAVERFPLNDQKNVLKELDTLELKTYQQGKRLMFSKASTKVSARIRPQKKRCGLFQPEHDALKARTEQLVQHVQASGLAARRGKQHPKSGPIHKVQEKTPNAKNISGWIVDLKQSMRLIIDALEKFSCEPWFSSLWTLQEGYLRSDAFLRDRNGKPWIPTRSEPHLSDFVDLIWDLSEALASSIIKDTMAAEELWSRIQKSGCLELRSRIPTVLLKASQNRTVNPMYANDRVYAIMQVFGFKLGRAAPDCPPDIEFNLDDLQDELGSALMSHSPIMSQMFLHTKPAPAGKGWRMSPHVNIPDQANLLHNYLESPACKIDPKTELSVTKTEISSVGHFSGNACNMRTLHGIFERSSYARDVQLHFDHVISGDSDPISSCEALLLGIIRPGQGISPLPTKMVCMLLSRSEHNSQMTDWRRRGLCFWDLEESFLRGLKLSAAELDLIHGRGPYWVHRSGTFG